MNHATRTNVATIGVIFGLGGMTHGLAEALQGNTPTGGLFINAIAAGSEWTRWNAGGEAAFTLIPNFLLTGILAMLVGLAIIVWSLGFVHRRYGPPVYLLLFVPLFLVGGGIAQLVSRSSVCSSGRCTKTGCYRPSCPATRSMPARSASASCRVSGEHGGRRWP